MSALTVLGRALLSGVFLGGSMNQLKMPEAIGQRVDAARQRYGLAGLPVASKDLVTANGAIMAAAGAALALGIKPKVASAALIASLVPTTVVGHPFWTAENEREKTQHLTSFLSNTAVLGGLLLVVAGRD